jgi:acyl-CoA synthetase (NDP forming)
VNSIHSPARNARPSTALTRPKSSVLDFAFAPLCIAVIGASATRGKWSNDVFRLLAHSYKGALVPVNPRRLVVEGVQAYSSLAAVPQQVDYALIIVERDSVIDAVRECAAAKVPVVHVLSAGFAEVGGRGVDLQRQLLEVLQGSETVLLGPNSMSPYSARAGLSFAWGCHFEPGPFAFVSQSGGLCYDLLLRGQARGLAFGKILSVGNCADLDWPDYVQYFATDPDTKALALYIESVTDGRRLYEELRDATRVKPVFVLKGGKTQHGKQSVVSHTGRLAGDYDTWSAVLAQAGATEVSSLDELLIALEAFKIRDARQADQQAQRPAVTMVIGTGGGATVLIADACEGAMVNLAPLDQSTTDAFQQSVPDAASLGGIGNPLDVGADRLLADPALLAKLAEIACNDPHVGSVLIHLNLIAVVNNLAGGLDAWTAMCHGLAAARRNEKLVCLVLRNGDAGQEAEELQRLALNCLRKEHDFPAFTKLPDALFLIRRIDAWTAEVGRAPSAAEANSKPADTEERIVPRLLKAEEVRALLDEHGIAVAPSRVVRGLDGALAAADALGYPVAIKTASSHIVHKSDEGCVRIDIKSPEDLRNAYDDVSANAGRAGSTEPDLVLVERMVKGLAEIVIGLKRSDAFGPIILVGMGGIWVEVMRDRALRLCPIQADEAMVMLRELRGLPMLTGWRGRPPCDLDALAGMIAAVSRMGVARDDIVELDLNPVLIMEQGHGAVAVDARAVVNGA